MVLRYRLHLHTSLCIPHVMYLDKAPKEADSRRSISVFSSEEQRNMGSRLKQNKKATNVIAEYQIPEITLEDL